METTVKQYRPTRRDDEIVIDVRSLREKLVDLKCKVVGAVQSAWSATKEFVLGRPGIQRQIRKAKAIFALQVLAGVILALAAYFVWLCTFILLLMLSPWAGWGFFLLTVWAIFALPVLFS